MLIYHPFEDSNHCCYRLVRLLVAINELSIPLTTLMICDFYCLFPGQLKHISGWPRVNSTPWKNLRAIPDEYEEMLNPKRVFFQLNSVQSAALSHLQAIGLVEISTNFDGKIALNKEKIPIELLNVIEADALLTTDWFNLIVNDLSKVEIAGKNGLKKKTGLMEYLYD